MKKFLALSLSMLAGIAVHADAPTVPPPKGLRIFTCGHSFHFFMPAILESVAEAAGIEGQQIVGLSAIGGLPVNAHWAVPDDKSEAKAALRAGKVDVLTLAPIWLPDPGIERFTRLALEHNPNIRITLQEFWLPNDVYDPTYPLPTKKIVDHNATTVAELRKRHEPYFQAIDGEVRRLNEKFGKPVLFAVPVGQAVLTLREKVVNGEVPGVKTQADLFHDSVGHPLALIQLLEAYCHYAVIYQRSPVGLPLPGPGKDDKRLHDIGLWTLEVGQPILHRYKDAGQINRLLQEIAWDAVIHHPLTGVHGPP